MKNLKFRNCLLILNYVNLKLRREWGIYILTIQDISISCIVLPNALWNEKFAVEKWYIHPAAATGARMSRALCSTSVRILVLLARRLRRWVALYRWRTFFSSRTRTGAEDEGEWKQFLSPGMKENIVLRRHRRQHRHPACRGTTRRCFVRKLHRRGAGNRQWFSLGPAAATNLGSVSLQPQWAMSGEWAEQIMGRTWLSEYVIIGTWIVSKLCFRWEMKYRGLLLLKFLSRITLSNVSKLLLQFKLSKSNHAKGYREGSMHRIQGTYYCVIVII